MKPGMTGLAIFVFGALALVLYSGRMDLVRVPPGAINSLQFALVYYAPRIILSAILLIAALFVILTKSYSQQDRRWAYSTIAAIVGFLVFG
jgi:hypothetical protein